MAESWVRLWAGMTTDPKWQTIARKSGQPRSLVIALFTHLMLEANEAEERGSVSHANVEDMASALDCDEEAVLAILQAMEGRVIVDGRLSAWDRRQPKREDSGNERTGAMSSTERSRLHRERKRMQQQCNARNDDATQCNAPEAESEAEKEISSKAAASQSPPEARARATDAAADPVQVRVLEIVQLLRSRGAAVHPGNPQIREWATQGVTDAQLLTAYETAEERRAAARSSAPINAGFLDSILSDIRAGPAARAPRRPASRAQRVSDWMHEAAESVRQTERPREIDMGVIDASDS